MLIKNDDSHGPFSALHLYASISTRQPEIFISYDQNRSSWLMCYSLIKWNVQFNFLLQTIIYELQEKWLKFYV